jgi:recombinational DNA repair protein RecR
MLTPKLKPLKPDLFRCRVCTAETTEEARCEVCGAHREHDQN